MTVILTNNSNGILINNDYAHIYDNMEQLAADIKAVQDGDDCSDWDNNEIDEIDHIDELRDDTAGCYEVDLDHIDTTWGSNAAELAQALKD